MIKKRYVLLIILFLLNIIFIHSKNQIKKNYYNNVFSGGKEKIISQLNYDNLVIEYAQVNINLFSDYSDIKITYHIKNNGNDTIFNFAFPRIDTNLKKNTIITENGKKEKKFYSKKIDGNYHDFSIRVNGNRTRYKIDETNNVEVLLPYKNGDTNNIYVNKNNNQVEEIDSYYYTYSWYVFPVSIKNGETAIINLKYKSPHYYNVVYLNNNRRVKVTQDPALKYIVKKKGFKEYHISEKIFNYLLCNSCNNGEKSIEKLVVKLKAYVIDQDYLKIFPTNYKRNGINYIWKYKNLKPKSMHNILVKILPAYSKNNVDLSNFDISLDKKTLDLKTFFELNKFKNDLVFKYNGDNLTVKSINIMPEQFTSKFQLKRINKPLIFEVEFADNPQFKDSVKFFREISSKKFIKAVMKKSYINIFKGKGLKCKYIRIKVLKTSNDNEIVRISDIQILK